MSKEYHPSARASACLGYMKGNLQDFSTPQVAGASELHCCWAVTRPKAAAPSL